MVVRRNKHLMGPRPPGNFVCEGGGGGAGVLGARKEWEGRAGRRHVERDTLHRVNFTDVFIHYDSFLASSKHTSHSNKIGFSQQFWSRWIEVE